MSSNKRKSGSVSLYDAIMREVEPLWEAGEYGEGLPDAPEGYFWMDSDYPVPPDCELAVDSSGHIWVLAHK